MLTHISEPLGFTTSEGLQIGRAVPRKAPFACICCWCGNMMSKGQLEVTWNVYDDDDEITKVHQHPACREAHASFSVYTSSPTPIYSRHYGSTRIRTDKDSIRFLIWNPAPTADSEIIPLVLRPGQTLEHYHGGETEEGFAHYWTSWQTEDSVVYVTYYSRQRDCDGLHEYSREMYWSRASPQWRLCPGNTTDEPDSDLWLPRWSEGEVLHRDHAAEAMNY